jgi:predicted phosphate transport protein (TIGR00153 family)
MGNYFSGIFGRSPFAPLQQHMSKVVACVSELEALFEAVIEDDAAGVEEAQQRVSMLENEADDLKIALRLQMPKGLFMPVSRGDLLNVLTMQDRIANQAKDIAGIVLGRQIRLPAILSQTFLSYLKRNVDACVQAHATVNELDELVETGFRGAEVRLVEKMLTELNTIESDTDAMEIQLRADLLRIERDLPPVDVMFLYKIIDETGELADLAQRVGGRIQLMLAR